MHMSVAGRISHGHIQGRRAGTLESAFEHWVTAGRGEGRPLGPNEGSELAVLAGATL